MNNVKKNVLEYLPKIRYNRAFHLKSITPITQKTHLLQTFAWFEIMVENNNKCILSFSKSRSKNNFQRCKFFVFRFFFLISQRPFILKVISQVILLKYPRKFVTKFSWLLMNLSLMYLIQIQDETFTFKTVPIFRRCCSCFFVSNEISYKISY
jgi:hypothetical protein